MMASTEIAAVDQKRKLSAEAHVAVVGLGYVGLPLAVEFGRIMRTVGFDLSAEKIASYRRFNDPTGEVGGEALRAATKLSVSTDPSVVQSCDFIIVAVPTPVDEGHLPDFGPLKSACRLIAPHLKPGVTVIFESTVYPGATEEICICELEHASGKKWKSDFFVGYSPERINPGDKEHTLTKIIKVVAGDTEETLDKVARLYESVVTAGVYRAESIAVAEAAKVLENTQRDLNIALMNELAIICHRVGIDTTQVLSAAGTKWNFLRFKPGLVGGHCIGVDPYYLTHKAERLGLHPQVILAGRRINDSMGKYIAEGTVKTLVSSGCNLNGARVAVLGFTFKENCPDCRNTKVIDVIRELQQFGVDTWVHDPRADHVDAQHEYGIALQDWDSMPQVDAVILAVAHDEYVRMPLSNLLSNIRPNGCVIDVKAVLNRDEVARRGFALWRL
jgi:UDP-N-acetyl-D-glucosamine/UDP-N-acetyl-D-galactosamine dehydrogenase